MAKNFLIIGAGPAGEAAAKTAARLRSSPETNVILIERDQPGGLCLNKGCIPSKTLLEQVHKRSEAGVTIDWQMLQEIKRDVVTGIRSQLEANLKTLKIKLVTGEASFHDEKSVDVKTAAGIENIPFDKAIVTAGTEIYYPSPLDQLKDQLLDSDRMLNITRTPASVAIIGGGAVGCEFACLLNAAGTKVTIVEMKDGLLPGEDAAVVTALGQSFEARGIVLKLGCVVKEAKKGETNWAITLSNGEKFEVEQLLACVGRKPSFDHLNLNKAGVKSDRKGITINGQLQTSNANIFAAGDVTGETRLAHAAAAQGEIAAANALGGSLNFDGSLVPRCLYSWPEVASVGTWKYEMEDRNLPVKTSRAFFKGSSKALAAGETEGFVQIVSDPTSGKMLGAQIIGAHATELIHIFSVALHQKMTLKDLSEVMFAHPTLGELIRDAARK